jgi:hypothetical protein
VDKINTTYHELDGFLTTLAHRLSIFRIGGGIPDEFLDTTTANQGGQVHKLIVALLSGTGEALGYSVKQEKALRDKDGFTFNILDRNLYKPDICLYNEDTFKFLIEFESTNSVDARIVDLDLRYYGYVVENSNVESPEYWVIIYTTPDHAVTNWYSHDYTRRDNSKLIDKRNQNPHAFLKKALTDPKEFGSSKVPGRENVIKLPGVSHYLDNGKYQRKSKLVMVNLTTKGLEVDFPGGMQKSEYLFDVKF